MGKRIMKATKIYIAGKVTGMSIEIAEIEFYKAEVYLRPQGVTINPLRICNPDWSWLRCMIVCVYHLLTKCNRIYLLHNWRSSRGARIELCFAIIFGKEILNG